MKREGAVASLCDSPGQPKLSYLFAFSHCWLATPQEVLQADWQEVWHSPHPPFLTEALRSRVLIVRILFIIKFHLSIIKYALYSINDFGAFVKRF